MGRSQSDDDDGGGTTGGAICAPLQLSVTLSWSLINNVLSLCRKRLCAIFRNSWEVRSTAGAN